ncbi:MAG: imelysin family protein [Pseudomonadales bacterium]|nr:imelysin family protein [Pseudomonadales bacterium]
MRQILLTSMITLSLSACVNNDSGAPVETEGYDVKAMLSGIADNIIVPRYKSLSEQTINLQKSISDYCIDVDNKDNLHTAQQAWQLADLNWQQASAYIVGPAMEAAKGTGPSTVYYYQLINDYSDLAKVSAASIDRNMYFFQLQAEPLDITNINTSETMLGLNTLEYLLFDTAPETLKTSDDDSINAWTALTDDKARLTERCLFTAKVAQRLASDTTGLYEKWLNSERNNFVLKHNESLTALSDSLFYLDTWVKDVKLAQALGINGKCSLNCAEKVESPFSQQSLAMIKANLEGFKEIFTAADGFGFDDVIIAKGYPEVSAAFIDDSNAAIANIDTLMANDINLYNYALTVDSTACENASANPESGETACHLHGYVKRITDRLKSDFVLLVDTNIPDNAQGDGD